MTADELRWRPARLGFAATGTTPSHLLMETPAGFVPPPVGEIR